MQTKMQIAIDGPASAGKSTVAKLVAKKLNYIYCDTGAMYRATTWKALQMGVSLDDDQALGKMLETMELSFKPNEPEQLVFVDGTDVTTAIRLPEITNNVSLVSAQPSVRKNLTERQQQIASEGGIVMDGRATAALYAMQAYWYNCFAKCSSKDLFSCECTRKSFTSL